MGIKFLKQKYEPKTYERADRHGRKVNFQGQAEAAADYLQKEQWGNEATEGLFDPNEERHAKCNQKSNQVKTNDSTPYEIRQVLQRMKKHKATGPDEIQMELFMLMDDKNLMVLADILNEW